MIPLYSGPSLHALSDLLRAPLLPRFSFSRLLSPCFLLSAIKYVSEHVPVAQGALHRHGGGGPVLDCELLVCKLV